MTFCPCGSQNTFNDCCAAYLNGIKKPQVPEQLMRSRYTAYSLGRMDYIKQTMKGKALLNFNLSHNQTSSSPVTWINLKIIQSHLQSPIKGYVEFIATYLEGDRLKSIHELSEFDKEGEIWFYVDGVTKPSPISKIARNSLCPCGSNKKFKNCHAMNPLNQRVL